MEETINLALDDATNEGIILMAQNEDLKAKEHGGVKDDGGSRETMEAVENEVICSGFGEIAISETRKSKRDEQLDNRELELEERELQWREREFEEERRKRMRMEEKMEEEKMEWRERMVEMQIEHEKQMMQMQAAIPSKSQTMAKKKPTRSANEPKNLPDHEEENIDLEQQTKTVMDKSMEKSQLQTLKSLNEKERSRNRD